MKTHNLLRAITCAFVLAFSAAASASDAVRIIVPFAQGDASDLIARVVAEPLSKVVERPVVVHNHYGAGGIIGTQDAVRSKTDGLTLILGSYSNMCANTVCRGERLGYVPSSSLRPVAMLARAPLVIAVNAQSAVGQFSDLIALFAARPGIQTYASSGLCSYSDFVAQYMMRRSDVDVVRVPYRGGHDAVQAALDGDVDAVVVELPGAIQHIAAGRLKPLAVSSKEPVFGAPTFSDIGFEQFSSMVWYGFFVPAETPSREVRTMLNAVRTVLKDPEVLRQFAALGAEPYNIVGPEIFREVVSLTQALEGYADEARLQLE
ncbi:MAG TPA: tripartite tricarboxylate transporter substrate binding protein [Burkholderiaceae bacterium]|nr:tripartite tricarboxylate transporter substrate binding protein [Burkholderiaceae bacterium]